MTPLGFVGPAPAAPAATVTDLQVRLTDVLASARRLWVRGRLVAPAVPGDGGAAPWWQRWWKKGDTPAGPPMVHVDTQVSGCTLEAEVPVGSDGQFEALLTADLPTARRGWRVARNRITFAGQTVPACTVVLTPPAAATQAVVVFLPLEYTFEADGPRRLAAADAAARWAEVFRQAQQGPRPLYYVACVPPGAGERQAELALAATTLGWPGGHFVVLPTERKAAGEACATALDRLRWLFAGQLDLRVVSLEPAFTKARLRDAGPGAERAPVRLFLDAGDELEQLCEEPRSEAPRAELLPRRLTRAGRVPRYPVVFCHGMLAMSTLRMRIPEDTNCFSPMRSFLRERGHRVLFPQVLPTGGVAARAAELRAQILRWTDEPVNLIAHSMGGLDARYLITRLGLADRVRSLTTVSTAHRGTYLADWVQTNLRQRVPLLLALEALGMNVDGFRDCGTAACRAFNEQTPDAPGVRYFSYGAAVTADRLSPMLRRAWNILTPVEGPNDGMVSLTSARWGEYLGTLNVDHFAQTPDAVFIRPGETFDALGFFVRLIEDLAWRGF